MENTVTEFGISTKLINLLELRMKETVLTHIYPEKFLFTLKHGEFVRRLLTQAVTHLTRLLEVRVSYLGQGTSLNDNFRSFYSRQIITRIVSETGHGFFLPHRLQLF